MAEILKVLKGTKDILPQDIDMWHFVEKKADEVFSQYGFKEIRTPIIEVTELFSRGVGDTTDIVNKEMYTFEKSDRSITLRPENTAGVVRSYIENGMSRLSAPVKLWYHGPMFRYERPQAGRQRQFHQVGVEMFGIKQPTADAEVILTAVNFLKSLGLNDLEVEINSLGCPKCREEFKTKLKSVLKPYLNELCEDCQKRYEKNPLRLLDCKVVSCQEIFERPEIQEVIHSDFICDECAEHYTELKLYLDRMDVKYVENKLLVRGLDYYNRTVFEIKSNNLGSQNAVAGGGRYDSLVNQLGGEPTPAIGFAMGMERLISLLPKKEPKKLDGYIVSNFTTDAFIFAEELRHHGLRVEIDNRNEKIGYRIREAQTSKIPYTLVVGDGEVENNTVTLRKYSHKEQVSMTLSECVAKLKEERDNKVYEK